MRNDSMYDTSVPYIVKPFFAQLRQLLEHSHIYLILVILWGKTINSYQKNHDIIRITSSRQAFMDFSAGKKSSIFDRARTLLT
jgi:hypothetical protein